MALDPSIPMRAAQGAQINLAELFAQSQQLRHGEQQMQQRDRQLDQQDRSFELQMQEHTARLDSAQREAAAKGLEDISAAVQWAQTPERWAQVQQHYARIDPSVATVPFEQREQVLITTGRMADYLKSTQERFQAIEPGGSLFGISPTGNVREVVRANPGTAAPMAPVGGPQPGQVEDGYRFKGGNPADPSAWEPVQGGPASAPGTFRP